MLSPGRGLRRASGEELMRRDEAVGWKVSALLTTETGQHELESWVQPPRPGRSVRIDGKAAPQTALGTRLRMVWLIPAMDRLWIEGTEGRRRFLDRLTMSFEPRHAEAALTYEKAMRDRNRLLRDEVRDPHWYHALEAQMAEAAETLTANRLRALARLTQAQEDSDSPFPAADLRLIGSDGAETARTAEDYKDAFATSRPNDLRAGRSLTGPHRADLEAIYAAKATPAAQSSTGEQKALLLSLVLANARALAQDFGAAPILLLDEVAAHLDANRRAALYDELCALKAQAFLTGTGPELFAELGPRAQAFAVTETSGTSVITSL